MTPAYIENVKGKLKGMRDSGELVSALVNPTRASIRDECLRLYPSRSEQKDRKTIADFFKHDEINGELLDTIYNVDLEDLKALQNFISGGTSKPNYKVVEMLAWLIDFQPRPYDSKVDYSTLAEPAVPEFVPFSQTTSQSEQAAMTEPKISSVIVKNVTQDVKQGGSKRRLVAMILLLLVSGAIVFGLSNKKQSFETNGFDQCMYWTGEKYEIGACIERGGDSVLAAYDPVRYRNFRRIMDTSLITPDAIGKVWYRKKDKKYEFYTMKGKHPVDGRELRGLTETSYKSYRESL